MAEGLPALSMRRLAERAEVSVATLYNLHGSRDAILRALIETGIEEVREHLAAVRGRTALARMRRLVDAFGDLVAGREEEYRSLFRVALADELKPLAVPSARRAIYVLRDRQREAVAEGTIVEALAEDLVATQIFELWLSALREWAQGLIETDQLRCRGHYSLAIGLLAVCADSQRPALRREARRHEQAVRTSYDAVVPA
jgi:AcrR family transcriptional regulator